MYPEKKSSFTSLPTMENTIVDGVLRYPSTGIKALVVGAGVAGLMTALECWRKGIDVEVIEKVDQILIVGMYIPSILCRFQFDQLTVYRRYLRHWPLSFDHSPLLP